TRIAASSVRYRTIIPVVTNIRDSYHFAIRPRTGVPISFRLEKMGNLYRNLMSPSHAHDFVRRPHYPHRRLLERPTPRQVGNPIRSQEPEVPLDRPRGRRAGGARLRRAG